MPCADDRASSLLIGLDRKMAERHRRTSIGIMMVASAFSEREREYLINVIASPLVIVFTRNGVTITEEGERAEMAQCLSNWNCFRRDVFSYKTVRARLRDKISI